jgi:hypothetical protein
MTEEKSHCITTPTLLLETIEPVSDWERQLLEKIRLLRSRKKRAILLIDEAVIFVYVAEPAGIIK